MMGGTIRNGGVRSKASGLEGDGSGPMMDSGRDLLEVLEERLRRQGSLQPGDWRRLLALCGSARASTREGALRLLFHPPVADEYRHQREYLHSGGRSPAEPDDPRFAWGGPVAPHQAWSSRVLCRWAEERRAGWAAGFRRLRALIRTGQEWLDAGRIDALVLPWIDKFFISSRRDGDIRYLSLLLEWLDGGDTVPVVLFWDDCSRKRSPSLKAALEKLEARRVKGVGVFGRGDVTREDALEAIVRSHHRYRLFALRPWTDTHHPMRLEEYLRTRRRTSLVPYDSSWKDNLAFLYSGTQVAAFLSIPYEMESRSPWVALEGRRVPFGVYWRRRLRTEIPGSVCPGADRDLLSQSYAAWANLLDEPC
ncbi:MAG: hypothetical protein SWC40_03990 [Thermodesulfobacteriota bacterium]|nr:hypothetical protein [Thermodesulfobacteriota bacterium]